MKIEAFIQHIYIHTEADPGISFCSEKISFPLTIYGLDNGDICEVRNQKQIHVDHITAGELDLNVLQSKTNLYQVYQGRLLASFQDDAKYEHVGQDTRSQGGKDDQDKQGKDLKISNIKTKSKDNDKGSRSKITKHEGTSLQRIQRPRPQDLNDNSNLIDLTKECHNELTSGEIVSLKILSRTRKFVHYIRSRSLN
ncbi:hypothetical protein Tco_0683699 [Tanacetum coccineum]